MPHFSCKHLSLVYHDGGVSTAAAPSLNLTRAGAYSAFVIVVNVAISLVASGPRTTTHTTEISATIKPYSTTVAPESS